MSLKLFLKTHSICFVESDFDDFDYLLKGSKSLELDELAKLYENRNTLSTGALSLIFSVLEAEEVELEYKYDSGMFYSRIEVNAYFEEGGLYCAAGGGMKEIRGVYIKGEKALEFLCENLSNVLQVSI